MFTRFGVSSVIASSFALLVGSAASTWAAPVIWTVASGGNGHAYEYFSGFDIPWEDARTAAEGMVFMGQTGHLATITSADENTFVQGLIPANVRHFWLGGLQPPGSTEPGDGWQWVNGETWSYTNWQASQPDNFGNVEHFLGMFGPPGIDGPFGEWNDLDSPPSFSFHDGYMVEFSTAAAAPASSPIGLLVLGSLLLSVGGGALLRYRSAGCR